MSGTPTPGTNASSFCTRCGKPVLVGSPFCTNCGAQQPLGAAPQYSQPSPAFTAQVQYAGFWLRFFAFVIDQLLLGAVLTPFSWGVVVGRAALMGGDPGHMGFMMGRLMRVFFISMIAKWLYFALMESSSKQATIGKMALGLRVTDLYLQPIDFGRATGRFFGKFLSGFTLFVGYIMAGFTARKQALHDMLAGTLVIRS